MGAGNTKTDDSLCAKYFDQEEREKITQLFFKITKGNETFTKEQYKVSRLFFFFFVVCVFLIKKQETRETQFASRVVIYWNNNESVIYLMFNNALFFLYP